MIRAARLVPEPTAFALSRGRKHPRLENGQHLKFIRGLPCAVCGTRKNVEAAHIRMSSLAHGKSETGIGEKSDDRWSVPLCADHHRLLPLSQHSMSEGAFWHLHSIDPFGLALALWGATGREEAAEAILAAAKPS